MLGQPLTYENFDGETVTETFWFHLSQSEILEFNVSYDGGLEELIKNITRAEDIKSLIALFKRFILLSYGVRSEDGKRFVKNDQLREEFTQMPAYDVLFMKLATDDDFAAKFIAGVIPKDFVKKMEELEKAAVKNVSLPPLPPESPKE